MENRFYKVGQDGGTYVVATLYNPITDETKTQRVRDYDYADGSRDDDELYDMPIDEEVRRIWLHRNGLILVGDTIKVVKGRKIPHGTVGKVVDKKPWRDNYGRTRAIYLYLDNGDKVNEDNCILEGGIE